MSAEDGGGGGGFTPVSWAAALFELSGSFSSAETVAVFEIVPPGCAGSTLTSTVTVHVAPFASEPNKQLTVFPELAEQSPPPSWTVSTESEAGTASKSATFEAASGPLFVT